MKYTVTAIVEVDEDNLRDARATGEKLIRSGECLITVQLECSCCSTMLFGDADECYKCWKPVKHTPKEKP